MAQAKQLVNKLKRRERRVKEAKEAAPKADKLQEVMQDSPAVQKAMRGRQRKYDRNWGLNMVGSEPHLEYDAVATTVERFDYDAGAPTDFGIRVTYPAALISGANGGSGVRVGDLIHFREGELDGRMLAVVAVSSSTELRCDDVATYVGPESNVTTRMLLSASKKSYT